MSIFDRVKHMADGASIIREWLGEGGQTVPYEQAQSRAVTCIACPKNQVDAAPATDAIARAIRRHLEVQNDLQLRVNGEKSLGECSVCHCQTKLLIWCPLEVIKRRMEAGELEKHPTQCWKRTESHGYSLPLGAAQDKS